MPPGWWRWHRPWVLLGALLPMDQETCIATSFTDAQDIRSLLEDHGAGLLTLQNNLGDSADVQLLGLCGCSRGRHALDQNRQKVSGSCGSAREHLTRDRGSGHADAVAILDEVRGRDAGAGDVLVVSAQRLFQQAHRGQIGRAHV